MWVAVIFDLPTVSPEDRRKACHFRTGLLKMGFVMHQESFYLRHFDSEEAAAFKLRHLAPEAFRAGRISILKIGDTAWQRSQFYNAGKKCVPDSAESFLFF